MMWGHIAKGKDVKLKAFEDLKSYNTDTGSSYTTLFIVFFLLFFAIGGLTKFSGMELSSPGITMILVLFIIAVISLTGFLTIDFSPNAFLNQHGIGLVYGLFTGGYLLGRLRDT